jgi:hypothetical protein
MRILICLLMLLLHAGAVASGQADPKESSRSAAADAAAPLTFATSFVCLSPGHTIAASLFVFSGTNTFAIKIPGVDCRESSGTYTSNGLMFAADFSATVLKQRKHYRYTFSAKGLSLFHSYIAGTMVLDERINETGQQQKVTFVFWGTSEAAGSEEKKNLFPF